MVEFLSWMIFCAGVGWFARSWLADLEKGEQLKKLDEEFEALKNEVWRSKGPVVFFVGLQRLRAFMISKNLLSKDDLYAFFEKHLVKIGPQDGCQFSENEVSEIKSDLLKLEIE